MLFSLESVWPAWRHFGSLCACWYVCDSVMLLLNAIVLCRCDWLRLVMMSEFWLVTSVVSLPGCLPACLPACLHACMLALAAGRVALLRELATVIDQLEPMLLMLARCRDAFGCLASFAPRTCTQSALISRVALVPVLVLVCRWTLRGLQFATNGR